MLAIAPGWELKVERGPEWLLVKVTNPDPDSHETPPLADQLWLLLERHFVYRMVLDLDEIGLLHGRLLSQLVLLQKRIHDREGMLRLIGISPDNQEVIEACGLSDRLLVYPCREDAIMGHLPTKPR
jgi:anti-anti-sigma regulatory factor